MCKPMAEFWTNVRSVYGKKNYRKILRTWWVRCRFLINLLQWARVNDSFDCQNPDWQHPSCSAILMSTSVYIVCRHHRVSGVCPIVIIPQTMVRTVNCWFKRELLSRCNVFELSLINTLQDRGVACGSSRLHENASLKRICTWSLPILSEGILWCLDQQS